MSIIDIRIPGWMESAACTNQPTDLFFPHEGGNAEEAKVVCSGCPVQSRCLEWCLDYEAEHPGSRWGVYGGTTPRQRRTLTAQNRKASA